MNVMDQSIQAWAEQFGWTFEVFLRLVMACLAGSIVGLERETRGRTAGLRTNLLVSLSGALIMVVAEEMLRHDWHTEAKIQAQADLLRVANAVMVGVGFMGSGIIVAGGKQIMGLTTAASLWAVAIIGLSAGLGRYGLCLISVALVLTTLKLLDLVEKHFLARPRFILTVRAPWHDELPEQIARTINTHEAHLDHYTYKRLDPEPEAELRLNLSLHGQHNVQQLIRHLETHEGWRVTAME